MSLISVWATESAQHYPGSHSKAMSFSLHHTNYNYTQLFKKPRLEIRSSRQL